MTTTTNQKLRSVLAYLCQNYPHPSELSKSRLTKMVYLADWRAALVSGAPLTDITWQFNHYGPYVSDVVDLAREDPAFDVLAEQNFYGTTKERITVQAGVVFDLRPADREVLDFVIQQTSSLYWNDFISLIYSTYPIRTQPRYSKLNLPALAAAYRSESEAFAG